MLEMEGLMELFRLQSRHKFNQPVQDYICSKLDSLKVPYTRDKYGAIFSVTADNFPIIIAHTDTVRDVNDDKNAPSLLRITKKEGLHIISAPGCVLGGDDLCGVYMLLKMIEEDKHINFYFSNNEEYGMEDTSRLFVKTHDLSHIPYGLVLDRRGNSDIICFQNNYGTMEFEKILAEMGKDYGYSPTRGMMCDADFFRNQISVANLSVGYYNAHSKKEVVVWEHLVNAYKYASKIIDVNTCKFEPNNEYLSWYYEREVINYVCGVVDAVR